MKIAQAAKQLDLSAATLRYYENIGLIRPIRRDENGVRDDAKRIFSGLNLSNV